MSVQGVTETKSNWTMPAIATVAGAGAGATVLAGAKYKTIGEMVEATSKQDSFEMPKAADNATDEVKAQYTTVKEAREEIIKKQKNVEDAFKAPEGGKAPEKVDFKAITGKELSEVQGTAAKGKLAGILGGANAKEGTIEVTDAMRQAYPDAEGAAKGSGLSDALKQMGLEVKEVEGKQVINVTKDQAEAIKGATKAAEENAGLIKLAESVEKGQTGVTKANADTWAKTVSNKAETAFDAIKKQFGKAHLKGAAIWGAVGLAVGLAAKAIMGNNNKA